MAKTLVLCSSMPEARDYYTAARERGEEVLATSSLRYDETAALYDQWEWLPDIYSDTFLDALNQLAQAHQISRIYCAHYGVWQHIDALRQQGKLHIPLVGKPALRAQYDRLHTLMAEVADIGAWVETLAEHPVPKELIAAILQQTGYTYGESSVSKLAAMIAISASLPAGDIIEIGTYWGKTAVALAMLARAHNAAVLCVDPWSAADATQHDSPDIVKRGASTIDWEAVFHGFLVNALTVATPGKFNYLRMPSVLAEAVYGSCQIHSAEFGITHYQGKIALIHIDGNHDYACVKADYETWRPHVVPDGWIVLDDYVWPHGEGPKRLGNEILKAEGADIRRSFVAGKALFLQF